MTVTEQPAGRAAKTPVLWGGYTWQYWNATRTLKPAEYQFFGVGTGAPAEPTAPRWHDTRTQLLVFPPVVGHQG